jgi:predicted MFS family arabinose efflux permease
LQLPDIVLFCEVTHAMTSAEEASQDAIGGARGFLVAYAEIFRIPRAWRFCAAGIIGRMPMSMYGLGTVLLISAATGEYGVAGSVSASGSLAWAVCAPQIAKLTDTRGQRRILLPLVTVFVSSVAGLILAVQLHAPGWVLFLPGITGGATMPPLGPMVRTRWSALLRGSPRLHTAFSLESVADEVCFILGPAAVTMLATQVHPAAGVATAALLCLGGSLWFAAQGSTEPAVRAAEKSLSPERSGVTAPAKRPLLPAPSLVVLAPVYVFLGAMFVSIDLSTVAFAAHFGHKPLAGFILGTYALGSATGGLWYGTRAWKAPAGRRLAVTLAVTVAGVCTFAAMPNLLILTLVIYLCGLTIAPTLIAGFSLMESQALPDRTTEAMSWLSTGISVGVACGATAVGFILDAFGPRLGYVFAASCGLTSVLLCVAGRRRLAVRP